MLTHDEIQQLQDTLATKDDIAKLDQKIDGAKQELKHDIAVLDRKLDKAQEDIAEILTVVMEHHSDLEHRVSRLEEHGGLRRS